MSEAGAEGGAERVAAGSVERRAHRSVSRRLAQPLLTGLLSFLPIALTLIIMAWLVVLLHDLVGPFSPFGQMLRSFGLSIVYCEIIAYFIGLGAVLGVVYLTGIAAERGLGRRYQRAIEHALDRVPVVGTVYDATRQLTSMFDRNNDDLKGMTPVVCMFGVDAGSAVFGLMPTPEPVRINNVEYKVVIIPTAPIPFGGALVCVRSDRVRPAACNVEGMVNVFVSMGVTAPEHLSEREPRHGSAS